jgi:O-6-methylguanine DNA methyltransferase
VAQTIGKPGAVRAVAGACAANKLAIVIPCHRVVREMAGCPVIAGERRVKRFCGRKQNRGE